MKSPGFQRKASHLQKDSSGTTSLKLQELRLDKKTARAMNKEREFIVKVTSKDLMELTGKSLSSVRRWIKEHEFDMVERQVEIPASQVSVEENEKSWQVQRQVETPTYTPTPVEPPVYPETSKFDFAQMASQSLQDNKPETKSDYWRRLRASMGDTDC